MADMDLLYTAPFFYYYEAMADEQTEEITYLRCPNCGEYYERSHAVLQSYCSEECAQKYSRCNTCGSYFNKASSEYEHFCSAECREAFYTPAIPAEYIHMHTHEEEESLL